MPTSWKRISPTNTDIEKEIISGLITNEKFLKEIRQIYKKELIQIPYAKTVADWCFDFYQKYNKAPESSIQEIYNDYSNSKKIDETQSELIGKFLSDLSDQHSRNTNVQYSIDKAEQYFRTRKIEMLKESLSVLVMNQKIDEAEKEIASFKRIGRSKTVGIDIIRDNISSILLAEDDVLFKFPGALGELVSTICREDYVLIAAPMKRGKTWWLQEFGLRALVRGLNVVFYSLEMSEKKMLRRIYQYFLNEPKYEGTIEFPYFKNNQIETKEITKTGLSGDKVNKKRKQIENMLSNNSFRLFVHPTGSINVSDIRINLDNLEHYDHFIPDVVVVDYADILAPEKGSSKEERHKLNETQKALRGLAQERHCVVITATQTTRDTFKKDIEEDSMAEDIRKLAHATTVLALNQTKEDKKKSMMRVSMIVVRDDEFHVDDEVVVLQCLKIGRPCLDSRWTKNINNI